MDKLVTETTREGDNGSLGGGIVEQVGSANVGVDGRIVDDAVSDLHVWKSVL